MATHPPPRSGGQAHPKPAKHTPIPTEWRIELPECGSMGDSEFGGCRSIEKGYVRGAVLGQGTYGEVYVAHDLRTKEKVAAKKIKMDNEKEGFPITAIREIKILSALANASEKLDDMMLRNNVIGLREIVRSGSHKANNFKGSIYMMFDYMDHDMTGLLERSQREGRRFSVPQVKCYLRQLFCGLALLETHDVLHRDLKNANLLVNNRGELKIADFGLARYFMQTSNAGGGSGNERRMTNRVITLWYRPPELFLGADKYATEIDMWSAGCIMFELLTGKPLFPGKDESDQVVKIFSIVGQPNEVTMPGCSEYQNIAMVQGTQQRYPPTSRLRQHCESRGIKDPEALALLERLLSLNPKARIKASKAVTHNYFFTAPLPCKLEQMPKFESSHEMTMKRARHEQRYGGAAQQGQRGGQQQQQQQQGGGGQPPAQRQRTQGQYAGPAGAQQQGQQYAQAQAGGQVRGGGGPGKQGQGQQPYRGGGGAPAAGGMRPPGPGLMGPPGGGMMPGPVLVMPGAVPQMMMAPGGVAMIGQPGVMMGQQQHAQHAHQQQAGGYGGAVLPGGALQQQQGHRPFNPASAGAGAHGAQPHRYGGGAQPSWDRQRR